MAAPGLLPDVGDGWALPGVSLTPGDAVADALGLGLSVSLPLSSLAYFDV